MLDDIVDGIVSNIGTGPSLLNQRASQLSLPRQVAAFAIGVVFWVVCSWALLAFGVSLRDSLPWWILLPAALAVMIVLFEVGFWCGVALVEPRSKATAAGGVNAEKEKQNISAASENRRER